MMTMKAKYALRALTELAWTDGTPMRAHVLAARAGVPGKFLETILVELRQAGMIDSRRGQAGGHSLARPASEIMVGNVIRTIDGPLAMIRCASVSAYAPCADCAQPERCSLRLLMREAREALSSVLDHHSLHDFAYGTLADRNGATTIGAMTIGAQTGAQE